MREILFRGKNCVTNNWVYGNYCAAEYFNGNGVEHLIVEVPRDGVSVRIIPETVGQYTGLTDENGKKIFEGDIVEGADFTVEDGGYAVVSFDEGAFEVSGNNIIGTFHENYWGKEFEVIGNIYDNPELL